MAPIDWNIVKYLNPQVSVSDKMDQQSQLSMEQALKQMQMKKMQDELARQDAIAQEMQTATSGPQASDPYQQILDMSSAYSRARMRQGLDANTGQILQSLDPVSRKYKDMQMQDMASRIGNRGKTGDKVRVWMQNPDTGEQGYVPRDQVDDYLSNGWEKLQKEDPIDARINGLISGRGAGGAGKMQPQGNPNRVKIIRKLP